MFGTTEIQGVRISAHRPCWEFFILVMRVLVIVLVAGCDVVSGVLGGVVIAIGVCGSVCAGACVRESHPTRSGVNLFVVITSHSGFIVVLMGLVSAYGWSAFPVSYKCASINRGCKIRARPKC